MTEADTITLDSSSSSPSPSPPEGPDGCKNAGWTPVKEPGKAFGVVRSRNNSSLPVAKRRSPGDAVRTHHVDELFASQAIENAVRDEVVVIDDDDEDDVETQRPDYFVGSSTAAASSSEKSDGVKDGGTHTKSRLNDDGFISNDDGTKDIPVSKTGGADPPRISDVIDNLEQCSMKNNDNDDFDDDDDDEEIPMTPEGTVLAEDSQNSSFNETRGNPFTDKSNSGKASITQEKKGMTIPSSSKTAQTGGSNKQTLSLTERLRLASMQEARRKQIKESVDDDVMCLDGCPNPFGRTFQFKPKTSGITSHPYDAFSSDTVDAFSQLTGYKSQQTSAPVLPPFRRSVPKDLPRTRVVGQMMPKATPTAPKPDMSARKVIPVGEKEFAMLSPEQREVLRHALDGESFFFTGAAGTGKSFLLRCIIAALQSKLGIRSVYVTARFVSKIIF